MKYLSHFSAIFVAVAGVWLVLLVVGWLFGFDNIFWLAVAALFGGIGPLVALIGGVFTVFRRRRYDRLGVVPGVGSGVGPGTASGAGEELFPLMYYRGTFSADGGTAYDKPPQRIDECMTVALPGAEYLVLSRAEKSLCLAPGQQERLWFDLGKELAVLPKGQLRDVSVELFDVAALQAHRTAERIGEVAGNLVGMALGSGTSKTIHFSAMIVLHYLHVGRSRGDVSGGELRQMLFAFGEAHGTAAVREHLEAALEGAGIKASSVLGGRYTGVTDESQQAALLAARLLRRVCGG